MSLLNKFKCTDPESGEQLVKLYFWFLVDEYGFTYYDKYNFRSKKMLIQVLPGHKTPRIDISKIGEPDPDLFKLEFEWIINFFHSTFPSDHRDYLKHKLEDNMIFISKIFRENSRKIINDFDSWWIPAHVSYYRTIEKQYRDEGQLERFRKSYRYYYEYLKGKDAI